MPDPTMATWLEGLGPGDEVIVVTRWPARDQLCRVTRTTPTRVYVGSVWYRRKEGRIGSSPGRSFNRIEPPTPERRQRASDHLLCDELARVIGKLRSYIGLHGWTGPEFSPEGREAMTRLVETAREVISFLDGETSTGGRRTGESDSSGGKG